VHRGSDDWAAEENGIPSGAMLTDVPDVISRQAIAFAFALSLLLSHAAGAQAPSPRDPRWSAINRVFGRDGEVHKGNFRVNLPRTDLRVRIVNDRLESGFELTSYVGFVPIGSRDVLAMGEVVLRDDELAAVLTEARRQGIRTPAVHNHLIGEQPRIVYVHVMAIGAAETIATKLKTIFSRTATPPVNEGEKSEAVNWSAIDAILGKHAEAEGRVAEYVFPRREHLTVHGIPVRSTGMLETASEVVFQQLEDGRVACGGELFLLPSEIDAVARALEEHGLRVTAVHNHMVDETPRMYWMHWYGTGNAAGLARGIAAALAHMNSARTSDSEE
jgi:hypothetical protein